jgi:hypothetical protein
MHIPVCYQNKYVIIIVFVFEMNVMYIDYVYGCYKHVYGCNACILTVYMDAMYMYIDGVYGCYIDVYGCNACILTVYMDVMYMYIDGVYGCYIHIFVHVYLLCIWVLCTCMLMVCMSAILRDYYMTFSILTLVSTRDSHIKPDSEAGGLI